MSTRADYLLLVVGLVSLDVCFLNLEQSAHRFTNPFANTTQLAFLPEPTPQLVLLHHAFLSERAAHHTKSFERKSQPIIADNPETEREFQRCRAEFQLHEVKPVTSCMFEQ